MKKDWKTIKLEKVEVKPHPDRMLSEEYFIEKTKIIVVPPDEITIKKLTRILERELQKDK